MRQKITTHVCASDKTILPVLILLLVFCIVPVPAASITFPDIGNVPGLLHTGPGDGDADGLNPASARNLQSSIDNSLHAFRYDEASGTWYAENYNQRTSIRTTGSGGVTFSCVNGSFTMHLATIGRDDPVTGASPGITVADGRTLTITRPGFTEWYRNGNARTEQGMNISTRPDGSGMLRVAFGLSGGLVPTLKGQTLYLSGQDGPVFRYTDLEAYDATGRNLPARLFLSGSTLVWEVNDDNAIYPVTIDPLVTQVKVLKASDQADNDNFGVSVAVSGSTAIVGARYAASGGSNRGQAYVFYKDNGGADNWGEVKVLKALDQANSDTFGTSVAIDGSMAVVGAPYANSGGTQRGQAYVFYKDNGGADNWGEVKVLKALDQADSDYFGTSVAIDGSTAVVGARNAASGGLQRGQAYVFSKDNGGADNWGQVKMLTASDKADSNWFGQSVAVSGSTAVVGAHGAASGGTQRGQAYVFSKDNGGADNWGQVKVLTASDKADSNLFGQSVAVSGSTVVVGAYGATSGGVARGQAYVFYQNQGGADNWGQVKVLKALDQVDFDYFGYSVAMDGSTAVVGAPYANSGGTDRGQAYFFYQNQGGADQWGQVQVLKASDQANSDNFGWSVAVSGSTAVVGARYAASGGTQRGQAYVFTFYGAPTYTSIAPVTGAINEPPVAVTITGTNFYGIPVVKLKKAGQPDITATGVTLTGSLAIDCTFDLTGAATGTWDVEITNPDGQSVTGANAFTVNIAAPTYTGIAPATGANTTATAVTITGTRYYGIPVVKLKKAGEADIAGAGVALTGSTTIDCTFDLTGAALGTWDIEITNPDAQSVTGANAFTVTPPPQQFESVSSDSTGTPAQIVAITGPISAGGRSTVAITSQSGSLLYGLVTVIEISVIPAADIRDSMITVQHADPGDTTRLPGNPPAAYFEIAMHWVRPDAVREADIRFTVPESWLTENHLAPAEIVMMRYHDGVWTALPTRLESSAGGILTYITTTPGFSYFAVTGNTAQVAATANGQTPAPSATMTEVVTPSHAPTQPAARLAEKTRPATTATTAVPASSPASSPGPPVAAIAAGSAGILIGGFLVRRWWVRRQNPALFKDYD